MKKSIKIGLLIGCLGILFYDCIIDIFMKKDFEETIISNGDILKCPQDIPKGYYDIEVVEGKVSVGLVSLDTHEIYHNYSVSKGSHLFIDDGNGKIKISQAKRKEFNDKKFIIQEIGNYIIGKDIPEGKYQITLKSSHLKNESIICFLNDDNENGIDQYSFKEVEDNVLMNFKNGEILLVVRDTKVNDNKTPVFIEFQQINQ